MSYFKTFFVAASLIILSGLFVPKALSLVPCDIDEPCPDIDWDQISPNLFIDLTIHCQIEIEVEKRVCDGTPQFRYRVVNQTGPECVFNLGDLEQLIDAIVAREAGVYDDIDEPPECGSGDNITVEKYRVRNCIFQNICTAEAILQEDMECTDGTIHEEMGEPCTCVHTTLHNCGSHCCIDKLYVCEDPESGTVVMEEYESRAESITECSSPPPGVTPDQCLSCR